LAAVASRPVIRRSPFLVTYWEHDEHLAYNYLTRSARPCSPLVVAILDAASEWTSRARVTRAVSKLGGARNVARAIEELIDDGTLEDASLPPHPARDAVSEWENWNPAAGFFHAYTQSAVPDLPSEDPDESPMLTLRDFPDTTKQYDAPRIDLPRCADLGKLGTVLDRRRTWREFGKRKLSIAEIGTLLGRTFGVSRWIEISADRWVALKGTPSGGARHSIEAYLLAFGIDGLASGTYHYHPDLHALSAVRQPTSRRLLRRFYRSQTWFQDPAAVIVMTSVFARVQYKYPHPHAYRVVLLDAGHLSQTFALVATAMRLAPFCTAAFDVGAVERHLRIDGVSESALLLLGVGAKPPGKKWAPMPDRSAPARTRPPAWAERLPAPSFP
jgi:SagB-type dehydrogenase family enzyme